VKLRQVLTYLIIIFIVWWVIQEPVNAAHLVHNIGNLLTNAAHGLSNFITSI
jgi:hypothetical protein